MKLHYHIIMPDVTEKEEATTTLHFIRSRPSLHPVLISFAHRSEILKLTLSKQSMFTCRKDVLLGPNACPGAVRPIPVVMNCRYFNFLPFRQTLLEPYVSSLLQ